MQIMHRMLKMALYICKCLFSRLLILQNTPFLFISYSLLICKIVWLQEVVTKQLEIYKHKIIYWKSVFYFILWFCIPYSPWLEPSVLFPKVMGLDYLPYARNHIFKSLQHPLGFYWTNCKMRGGQYGMPGYYKILMIWYPLMIWPLPFQQTKKVWQSSAVRQSNK